MLGLLQELGSAVERNADGTLSLTVADQSAVEAPYKIVEMRATSASSGRSSPGAGHAQVSMPGGCNLALLARGPPPEGVQGARRDDHDQRRRRAGRGEAAGDEIFLSGAFGSTSPGTANLMMAATLAEAGRSSRGRRATSRSATSRAS